MNSNDHEILLNHILAGEEVEVFRRQLLAGGIKHLRWRRRGRRLARASFVLVLALVLYRASVPDQESPTAPASRVAATAPIHSMPLAREAKVELIGDKELQQLLPGKILALIGPPGDQRLLVFDVPDAL